MRPLRLELYGFGAFAKPCNISFEPWQNGEVFLITGETGAGKTTIFDAICFALYGKASGSERDSKQFRSQYLIDSSEKTEVQLEFVCQEERYLVIRNPAYTRQKRMGIGLTAEAAKAVLYKIMPDGKQLHFCEGPTNVTQCITNLVGMDDTQFRQIVMIAQGEFRRFLLANSKDKSEILSQLFHTESCSRIQELLKQHYDEQKRLVEKQKLEMQTRLQTVLPKEKTRKEQYQNLLAEEISASWKSCCKLLQQEQEQDTEQLPLLKAKQQQNQQKADQLVQELAQGKQHNQNLWHLEKEQKQLAELQQKQAVAEELVQKTMAQAALIPEWQAEKGRLEHSIPEYQHFAKLQTELSTLQAQQTALQQEQVRRKATLEQTKQQCTYLQKELESQAALSVECETIRSAITSKEQVYTLLEQLQQQFLSVQEAERLRIQYEQQAQRAHQRYFQLEKPAYEKVEQRFFQSMAGNLAATLTTGKPCPVCGATEHPQPAKQTEQTVTERQFQTARKNQEAALQAMQAEKSKLEKQAALTEQLFEQKKLALEQHKLSPDTTLETVKSMLQKTVDQIAALKKEQTQKQAALQTLQQKQERLNGMQQELPILQNGYDAKEQELQTLAQTLAGKQSELTYIRSTLQYATLQEVQNQLLCLKQKIEQATVQQQRANVQAQELAKQISACQAECKRLETEIAGKPLYAVQKAEQQLQEVRQLCTQNQQEIVTLKANLQRIQEVLATIQITAGQLERTQTTCQRYKELYSMMIGTNTEQGGERISLERYVQTYYFIRILEHANQKLQQLSNGRYQLIRRSEEERRNISSGLNLNVLDEYTGTERDVKTLSGGETFLASLSLALGLSEAVQQQSGCVQIDAMFIDEGFGSLDEMALENAIRMLQRLSGHHCMVGVISHVPALSERFDAQIRVEKTPHGSRAVCVGVPDAKQTPKVE